MRVDITLFSTIEEYQRYKQHFAQRQVVPERISIFPKLRRFGFEGLFTRMGWFSVVRIYEPVFSTLV